MLGLSRVMLLGILGGFSAAVDVRVDTSFGPLIGERSLESPCDRWLGIPFAEPPVGELRFAAPAPWRRSYPAQGREAKAAGPACAQPVVSSTEDCLYLNVWRPHGIEQTAGLAVMVWIYGGAFSLGSGVSWPLNIYDGCRLAETQQVVFVSFNYRLGPFGFGTFKADDGTLDTNFGMKDQREAMRWVQAQVRNFGGDPAKVTIFGQSAGGISVFHHTVSPLSRGLFRAGVSESGIPFAASQVSALRTTLAMATKLGCANVSMSQQWCLRTKSVEEVLAVGLEPASSTPSFIETIMEWMPVVDGVELLDQPLAMIHQGRSHVSALMAGSNTNDGNIFVWPAFPLGLNDTTFKDWARHLWNKDLARTTPEEWQRVFDMYPMSGGNTRQVAGDLFTDVTFLCGMYAAMDAQSRHTDAFVYRFNWREGCRLPYDILRVPGIYHGMELPYVFGDHLNWACLSWGPESEALSKRMMRLWGNFAKHLDPSYSSPGTFPKYNDSRRSAVLQGPQDWVEESYRSCQCQLWEDVLYSKLASGSTRRIPERTSEIVV